MRLRHTDPEIYFHLRPTPGSGEFDIHCSVSFGADASLVLHGECSSISNLETLPLVGAGIYLKPIARIPSTFELVAMEGLKRSSRHLFPWGQPMSQPIFGGRNKVLTLNRFGKQLTGPRVKRTVRFFFFLAICSISIFLICILPRRLGV